MKLNSAWKSSDALFRLFGHPRILRMAASLLGDDFVCSPSAGGVRFATVIDQTYHKDGTASDLPVRDPLARELLCFCE